MNQQIDTRDQVFYLTDAEVFNSARECYIEILINAYNSRDFIV